MNNVIHLRAGSGAAASFPRGGDQMRDGGPGDDVADQQGRYTRRFGARIALRVQECRPAG
ncbi:hypothetical protein AA12717_0140 [Gluconacetobacter sacchari DSM 12717]|uniref:Uncharacterized protein n=1 Tax=Gluconacetobacter sacchari DSM 12717 TaxID=1307940 RepID=A0ABQ0P235_9PROT|nr:hypothetical protein AA12717_0140 [Gluconacetobacter sacchari DSM 12717]